VATFYQFWREIHFLSGFLSQILCVLLNMQKVGLEGFGKINLKLCIFFNYLS
jgi:hypothetical protein